MQGKDMDDLLVASLQAREPVRHPSATLTFLGTLNSNLLYTDIFGSKATSERLKSLRTFGVCSCLSYDKGAPVRICMLGYG